MNRLILTILFLIFSSPAWAAVAHVQTPAGGADCGAGVSTCQKAFGSNNTAGNFLVVHCRYGATGRTVTITDTVGNTYVGNASSVNSSNVTDGATENIQWTIAPAIAGANTITCTVSGATSTMRLIISEFSGVGSGNPKDQSTATSSTGTTPASGSITPTENGELLYAWEGNGNVANFAAGTDFTMATRTPDTASARIGSEYYIQPTAAAHDGTFTVSQTDWSAGIISFKSASVATTGGLTVQGGMVVEGGMVVK